MFRRERHRHIEHILTSLEPGVLVDNQCWFGGGTAIALLNGEYRESVDIDFLVSDYACFRRLREIAGNNLDGLSTRPLDLSRPVKADRYGIRTHVLVNEVPIKFEIVHEGRIALDAPKPSQSICGIRALTTVDQVASKLLANDDRWADRSVFSRDIIDLAMMRPNQDALHEGLRKAEEAYHGTVRTSVAKAIDMLRANPKQLASAVHALRMEAPVATVLSAIDRLSDQIAATPTTYGSSSTAPQTSSNGDV